MGKELIVSVIPARSGSKTVPNKNIKDIAGQPLISYAILDSLRMKDVSKTFVSTDSLGIKAIAEKYGADVPFQRPAKYCRDNSPDIEWVRHFLTWFRLVYDKFPEYIVHLRATTPVRDIDILNKAITTFIEHTEATSLRSVEVFPETPYKWVKLDENGYFQPLLNDDKDAHIKPKQDFPNVYRPNGYIDIYKTSTILEGSLCGDKILSYVTPLSIEIDDYCTFEWAESMLFKKQ